MSRAHNGTTWQTARYFAGAGVGPALGYAEARELVRHFVVDRELGLDGRDASSHFDRASGAWIFEWSAGAGGVTLSVDVTKAVRGRRCAPDDARDCSPIA